MFSSRLEIIQGVGVAGSSTREGLILILNTVPGNGGGEEGILFRYPHPPSLNYLLSLASPPRVQSLPPTEPAASMGTEYVYAQVHELFYLP